MSVDLNKREYIALPLDYCYFDRTRYDKIQEELPTEIISFRNYETGQKRILFETRTREKGKETQARTHLLWIELIEIEGKKYVKYRCDCKYFEYRQLRPAKRLYELQQIEQDLVAVIEPKIFASNKELFNIDKHAFLALKELLKIQIPVTI